VLLKKKCYDSLKTNLWEQF